MKKMKVKRVVPSPGKKGKRKVAVVKKKTY